MRETSVDAPPHHLAPELRPPNGSSWPRARRPDRGPARAPAAAARASSCRLPVARPATDGGHRPRPARAPTGHRAALARRPGRAAAAPHRPTSGAADRARAHRPGPTPPPTGSRHIARRPLRSRSPARTPRWAPRRCSAICRPPSGQRPASPEAFRRARARPRTHTSRLHRKRSARQRRATRSRSPGRDPRRPCASRWVRGSR